MPRTELAPPTAPAGRGRPGAIARLRGRLVLGLHRLLDRFDLVPPEFGSGSPIDADDPRAVVAEWRRYLRLWGDYNPEELFALKVGGVILFTTVGAIWLAIAFML